MSEADVSRRISIMEADIKNLYEKVNKSAVSQAQTNTKLDNMLINLGELKESIRQIKERPASFWDKLLLGFIGALGAALIGLIIN